MNLDILQAKENIGYGASRIPSKRDREIVSLLERYIDAANKHSIRWLAGEIREEHCSALEAFAERAASWAVRENEAHLLELGVVALGLASQKSDEREIVIAASLVWRAAELIGTEPGRLFHEAASLLAQQSESALARFAARRPDERQIRNMGFRESRDVDGFRFVCSTELP